MKPAVKRCFAVAAVLASLAPISLHAHAGACTPVSGVARLAPDPQCNVSASYPGPAYLGAMGLPGTCHVIELWGSVRGSGFAGLTAEYAANPLGSGSMTPMVLSEAGVRLEPLMPGMAGSRLFFTARTVLQLKGGRVFTADAGVVSDGHVTEQLRIVGGDGAYEGSSGTIYVTGDEFAGAPYRGDICRGGKH